MARIRTIKPEFFTSADIIELTPLSRLFYVSLWCESDREGRLNWNTRTLKFRYFPADDCDIDAMANELIEAGLIGVYQVDGRVYAEIPSFKNHQVINNRESDSFIPARVSDAPFTRESGVQGEGKGREGKGKEGKGREVVVTDTPKPSASPELFDGIDPQVIADFKALRNKQKAPITKTSLEGIKREADIASITMEAALTMCCERGWRGFKAEWVANSQKSQSAPADLAAINARNNAEAKRLLFGSDEDEMRTIYA